jgi:hypothetical protein
MSESINNKHEVPSYDEKTDSQLARERNEKKNLSKETPNNQVEHLESARKTIEKQAVSGESLDINHEAIEPQQPHHYVTKQIKSETYKSTLKQVQKHLSPTEVWFSKFIHQPKIESISEIGAKIIARPTAIISGGLFALITSIIIIAVARHIGFTITPIIFIVLFAGGYILGVVLELFFSMFIRMIKRKPNY